MTTDPDTPEPKRPEHPIPHIEACLRELEALGATVGQKTTGGVEFTGDFVRGLKRTKAEPPPRP